MGRGSWIVNLAIFVIGGLIGAGIGFSLNKCKVQQTSIRLDSEKPGITITNTGDGK